MKRTIFFMMIVALLALVPMTMVSASGGPHMGPGFSSTTDACAGCHRAHTATQSKLLNAGATQVAFCYSCHSGMGADTDVEDGIYLASGSTVWDESPASVNLGGLRGGGFSNCLMDIDVDGTVGVAAPMTSAHTVDGSSGTMWGAGPISAAPDSGGSWNLVCTDCHDPHGNLYYRMLRPYPKGMPGDPVPVAVGVEDESTKLYTVDYVSSNYKDTSYAADNLGNWCTQCHTRYLGQPGDGSGTDTGDAIYGYRHMTQGTLLGCIKCHVAHGTSAQMGDYSGAVPWPDGDTSPSGNERSSLLHADSRGVCSQCHVQSGGGGMVFGNVQDSYHGQMGIGTDLGMLEKWCALPNLNYALEGMDTWNTRCGKCHVGASWNPDKPYADCIKCHEGGIGTGAVGMGTYNDFSTPGCLSCHMKETPKRGMVWDASHDVHLTTDIFGTGHETTCQDCHERQADANSDHQFAKGTSIDTSEPTHQGTLSCGTCHTSATLHADAGIGAIYDNAAHAGGKVACETCHIGQRDANTALATRSWTTLTATGSFTGTKRTAAFMPFYKWYDNTGPGPEGNGHLPILDYTTRQGDPGAMIYPFNPVEVTWFALDVDGTLTIEADEMDINILIGHVKAADQAGDSNLTTTTAEMVTWWGDLANATEVARYTTEYGTISGLPIQVTEGMNFNISHGVLSGAAAECGDCHTGAGSGGRLNWTQLGYGGDPFP